MSYPNQNNKSIYPTNYSNQPEQNVGPYPNTNSYPRQQYSNVVPNLIYPNSANNSIPHPFQQKSNPPYPPAASSNFPYPSVTPQNSNYPEPTQLNPPYPTSELVNSPYPSPSSQNSSYLSLEVQASPNPLQSSVYTNILQSDPPKKPTSKPYRSPTASVQLLSSQNSCANLIQSPIMPSKPQPASSISNPQSPYINTLTDKPNIPGTQNQNIPQNPINPNYYSPIIKNKPENIPLPSQNSSNINYPYSNITPSAPPDLNPMPYRMPYPSNQEGKIPPPTLPKPTVVITSGVPYSSQNGQIQTNNSVAYVVPQDNFSFQEQKNHYKKIKSHMNSQPIPTLKPNMSTDAVSDSIMLHKSLKRLVGNKEAVRNIIARRNTVQRATIRVEYQTKNKKSLIDRIKKRLTDPYERIISCLIYSGPEIDAYLLFKASKFIGYDESAYRDILATRTPAQIAQIKDTYFILFKTRLDSAIQCDTSGSFRDILLTLINEPRDQTTNIDMDLARRDATDFSSRKFFNINAPSALIPIFCKRSYSQLNQTFKTYQEMSGNTILHYLKKFIYGDYEKCLVSIYNFCHDPVRYHSKHLREGILKKSINHIIRVVVTHCDYNLGNILQDYQDSYESKFSFDLKKVFGDIFYQDTLDTICILIGEK